MKKNVFLLFILITIIFSTSCTKAGQPINQRYNGNLALARETFNTVLKKQEAEGIPLSVPPEGILTITEYTSPIGSLSAYITPDPETDLKYPAIIWIGGGFSSSPDSGVWEGWPSVFIEHGIVSMYPSFRGGCDNPGYIECLYGEVDDIIAAAHYLTSLPYVDSDRIYLAGHSSGGTLALLTAESAGDLFRAVFAFGPVGYIKSYHSSTDFPFDKSKGDEMAVRSPILWLDSIQSKTFVMEGMIEGNVEAITALRAANNNDNITFYSVSGYSHFTIVKPGCSLIADKILGDIDEQCNINLSLQEFNEWEPN